MTLPQAACLRDALRSGVEKEEIARINRRRYKEPGRSLQASGRAGEGYEEKVSPFGSDEVARLVRRKAA